MQIDRIGTFLVEELDRALGQTSKAGLPQLTIKVRMLHWFDESANDGEGAWLDFSECGMEGIAFCTLAYIDKDGNQATTFQHDNLISAYHWDGRDYGDLAMMTAPETFQVRVEDNDAEYADKNPYVINRISAADADPRGGLKKLDAAGIQALQAKFGGLLNKTAKKAPPASAKKAPPVAPVTGPPKVVTPVPAPAPTPVSESEPEPKPVKPTAAEKKAAKKAKSERVAKANAEEAEKQAAVAGQKTPPKAPTVPVPVPDVTNTATEEEVTGSKTKQEAYEYVYEMQAAGVTDDQRNAAWNAATKQIVGDVDHKEITGEQWYKIMHETLNDVGAV